MKSPETTTGTVTPLASPALIAALLSFNGGYIDGAGFLGLNGLFLAHVTGNLATLCAAVVLGSHGIAGKIFSLPEFFGMVALARLAGIALEALKVRTPPVLLGLEVTALAAFCAVALVYGPFADADTPLALLAAFAGISAMAVQNSVQRVYLASEPPTTFMTGNTTDFAIGFVDTLTGKPPQRTVQLRKRVWALARSIACFSVGCASAALLYWYAGFWCLLVPVALTAACAAVTARRP